MRLSLKARVVTICGPIKENVLERHLADMRQRGIEVRYHTPVSKQKKKNVADRWPYSSAPVHERLKRLHDAFKEFDIDFIIASRGGYGASDLLPLLDWSLVSKSSATLVGFSDVSALHAGLYAKLARQGLHAPMPASSFWWDAKRHAPGRDVRQLIDMMLKKQIASKCKVRSIKKDTPAKIEGICFGGNFATLTNLIGTPYMPRSLRDHLLFFEDVSENGGRLIRYLNQWKQSGMLIGVRAIVWGAFTDVGKPFKDCDPRIYHELSSRVSDIPTFFTHEFGHVSPNVPVVVGGLATIEKSHFVTRFL